VQPFDTAFGEGEGRREGGGPLNWGLWPPLRTSLTSCHWR